MTEIQQDVKFIGMGDTIEIWSDVKVEASQMGSDEFGKALEEIMAEALPTAEIK
jgi:MraZ protein